jgi:hypothetical protein
MKTTIAMNVVIHTPPIMRSFTGWTLKWSFVFSPHIARIFFWWAFLLTEQ